jgi:hypothetical protein
MGPVEMIGLACCASSILSAVVAGYFFREVLSERLRASLWWAAGFAVFALGMIAITGAVWYEVHRGFVLLSFALVAVSAVFFYYAGSLLFFGRKSFFREKVAVILFAVSFVLFLLFVYLPSEEHLAETIRSPAVPVTAVALVVITVVFNRVAGVYYRIVWRLPTDTVCRKLGILQPAVWILAVWCLYSALFTGSTIAAGIVFVLISCEFILFLYHCTEGEKMAKKREENELTIQAIDSFEYKFKRKTDSIQVGLRDAMQKVGDALIYVVTVEYGAPESETEDILCEKYTMMIRASTLGMIEDELMGCIAELAENTFRLAKSYFEDSHPHQLKRMDSSITDGNGPPLGPEGNHFPPELCGGSGGLAGEGSGTSGAASGKLETLGTLALFRRATDRDMVETCCELVRIACYLEYKAVTKMEWKGLLYEEHPEGITGHTYNILRIYDEETKTTEYAEEFRKRFREEADNHLEVARELEKKADALIETIHGTEGQATLEQAKIAARYMLEAINLLENATLLVRDASAFVGNRINPPVS